MYEFVKKQKLNIATALSVIVLVLFYAVGASASGSGESIKRMVHDDFKDFESVKLTHDKNITDRVIINPGTKQVSEVDFEVDDNKIVVINISGYQPDSGSNNRIKYSVSGPSKYADNGSDGIKSINDYLIISQPGKYRFTLSMGDSKWFKSRATYSIKSYNPKSYSGQIKNLRATPKHTSVDLSWDVELTNPDDLILFYTDGIKTEEIPVTTNTKTIKNLTPNTSYTFGLRLKTTKGELSDMAVVTTKTLTIPKDITSLQAKATHERVDLSWQLPESEGFKHVNIYRDEDKGLLKNLFGAIDPTPVVYAADDDDTKIFETNGTYFNDLTVKPDTKYKYKLTTTTTDGQESKGITTSVKTLKKPTPKPPKTEIEVNDNDDYVVKWTQDKGKIKIFVGDKLYATVEASKGSHTIPRDDMVYNWLDQPQIKVVWVDEDGDESESAVPGLPGTSEGGMPDIGLVNPISALDVTTNVFDFLRILSPYLLIAMLIRLAVQIINVIRYRVLTNRKHDRRAKEEDMYGDYRNRYGDSD